VTDSKLIEVNDDTFNNAVANAPFWARRRLFKKMTKAVYGVEYKPTKADPKKLEGFVTTRPPKDVEQYVERFVRHYYRENPNGKA